MVVCYLRAQRPEQMFPRFLSLVVKATKLHPGCQEVAGLPQSSVRGCPGLASISGYSLGAQSSCSELESEPSSGDPSGLALLGPVLRPLIPCPQVRAPFVLLMLAVITRLISAVLGCGSVG